MGTVSMGTCLDPLPWVTWGDVPTGEPEPRIEWSKLRAPLPWQHRVVNGTLVIPRAAQQDSGQYICNASSPTGFTEVFITLDVESKGLRFGSTLCHRPLLLSLHLSV